MKGLGSYLIRLKLLPPDTTTDLQKLVDGVGGVLPAGVQIRGHKVEPIAFGLSAVIMDVVTPEEEGMVDKVEEAVSRVPVVNQCEVLGVSRMSSRLPPQ